MAKLIETGHNGGRVIELNSGLNRVGRSPDNDIVLNDASVSSFHCEIQVAEIAVSVKDLGSTNGTFINQKQIVKGILQNRDLLTIGTLDFQVELPEVHIAIPDLPQTEQVFAAFLDDGTPACMHHREVAAVLRCTKCENWYCMECVRVLKKLNGEFLHFCQECSAPCVPIQRETSKARKSFMERLGETLRIRRK